jgi:hypothetical protein
MRRAFAENPHPASNRNFKRRWYVRLTGETTIMGMWEMIMM